MIPATKSASCIPILTFIQPFSFNTETHPTSTVGSSIVIILRGCGVGEGFRDEGSDR